MERAELIRLLRGTGCAVERSGGVFLCDPQGSPLERAQAERVISQAAVAAGEAGTGWLAVRTGGSSGGVKFARHDERTLAAAVAGFCAHFGLARVNAVNVLPVHHVSGLLAAVRCTATGGEHMAWDWKRLEAGEVPVMRAGPDGWVISLVPTQLQRLLARPDTRDWLARFRLIFVGGGPLWPDLAAAAATAGLRVSISYGMTETAAMVAALTPEEFIAGDRSCGRALPHARVDVASDGVVRIDGESVFRGYWPETRRAGPFETEDLGRMDGQGRLHLLGRRDAMIISGGKKIAAADVEAALRASGEFCDVAVIGVPDPEWGERVVACYPAAAARAPDLARAVAALAPAQRPKRFVPLAVWPRNAQGKINRAELRQRVLDFPV
ncbi:MAG: AMP-binding protein [Verrucomicrobiota bacterium]